MSDEEVMHELMPFKSPNGLDGVCRVEIRRLKDERFLVVCEELDDNPGQSVSASWENVVSTVGHKYGVPVNGTVWVEHNDREYLGQGRWQLVTFKLPKRGQREGEANWHNMTEADWHELGLPPRK